MIVAIAFGFIIIAIAIIGSQFTSDREEPVPAGGGGLPKDWEDQLPYDGFGSGDIGFD